MQSIFATMLTIAKGTSVIVENIFENRYKNNEMIRKIETLKSTIKKVKKGIYKTKDQYSYKGKELTEYNNELRNRINQLKPCNIIIQREQITRNVTKRKKYFDSGKITFEKFLEIKGIKLFECRKDGKQDSSLIKDRFLELKSSLNKINVFYFSKLISDLISHFSFIINFPKS